MTKANAVVSMEELSAKGTVEEIVSFIMDRTSNVTVNDIRETLVARGIEFNKTAKKPELATTLAEAWVDARDEDNEGTVDEVDYLNVAITQMGMSKDEANALSGEELTRLVDEFLAPTTEAPTTDETSVVENNTNKGDDQMENVVMTKVAEALAKQEAMFKEQMARMAAGYEQQLAEVTKPVAPEYTVEQLEKVAARINQHYGYNVASADMPVDVLKKMVNQVREIEGTVQQPVENKSVVTIDGKEYTADQADRIQALKGTARETVQKGYDAVNRGRVKMHGSLQAFADAFEKHGHQTVDGASDLLQYVVDTAYEVATFGVKTTRKLGHGAVDVTANGIRGVGNVVGKKAE